MLGRVKGHAWTIGSDLRHRLSVSRPPQAERWTLTVDDIQLTGWMRHEREARVAIVAVHGLGGDADSGYVLRFAWAAARRGLSLLRINLRGAGLDGADVYHAGLVSDLAAAAETLAGYRVFVVGFSLGGHLALRLALDPPRNVEAVVAVSSPLDLGRSCAAIDRRRAWVYRNAVLGRLKDAYRKVAERHGGGSPRVPTPWATVKRVRTIWDWDDLVVVPRHGFDSVAHYHRSMSVGSRLHALAVPALYFGSRHDPMVPPHTVESQLLEAGDRLTVRLVDTGGHVAFPGPWEHDLLDFLARA
jgi:hypothetical protein